MKGNEPPTHITAAALSDIYSPFLSFIESSAFLPAGRQGDASVHTQREESARLVTWATFRCPHGLPTAEGHTNLEDSDRNLAKNFASLSLFRPRPGYL